MTTSIQKLETKTPDMTPEPSNPGQEKQGLDVVAVQLNFVQCSVQWCTRSSESRLSSVIAADLVIIAGSLDLLKAGEEVYLLDESSHDVDDHEAGTQRHIY